MDKVHSLYNGEIKIEFKENCHGYWLLGDKKIRLCGVTTYIGVKDKSAALIPWAVGETVNYIRDHLDDLQKDPNELLKLAKAEAERQKQEAADLGTQIHKWCEEYIRGNNPEMPEDDKVLTGVNSFLEWMSQNKAKFLETEKVVYSKKYGYVGTLDIVAEIDGKLYLIDIKTGNGLYSEVKMQTAAYLMAEIEETGREFAGRWALRISKETEDDYKAKMAKKGKEDYPEFKIFEALFLDEDETALEKDFMGFKACIDLYQWDKYAMKEMKQLKN